jgi:hypothetical protein
VVEAWRVGYVREAGQGSEEVGLGGTGVGLETFFGEGASVKDDFYSRRGVSGENLGGERSALYVVEGEAGAVRSAGLAGVLCGDFFWDGIQVSGGDTGLEDEMLVGFGDTVTIVEDDECAVAADAQARGDVDVAGTGIAGVAQELGEGVLDGAKTPRTTSETLDAKKAGEAGSEIPVRSFQEEFLQ